MSRSRLLCAMTMVMLLVASGFLWSDVQGEQQASSAAANVPADWWGQVQKDIAVSEYNVSWQDATLLPEASPAYQAPNRAHDLRTYFTDFGPRVVRRTETEPSWTWGLELLGISGETAAAPQLAVNGNRIEYRRGNFTEWYVNSEKGLEQGFTIADSSVCSGASTVEIDLAVRGDLAAGCMPDGETLEFLSADGVGLIHYGHLKAFDATGRELYASMELLDASGGTPMPDLAPSTIRLRVDVTGAVFPVTIDPLATSAVWTAESNQVDGSFGESVSTAGDVNGDGYADVIVGAHLYDHGQLDEGRAFVYYGSASGLSASAAWTVESDQASARFGQSASTAGDVNGDGYSDVIVGAYYYNNGELDEGRAYVYHGSATGLSATANWTAESNQANAYFGYSVSTAGDVNGDGYSDVIIGAYKYSNVETNEGRAHVYHGSASGLSASAAWTMESNQASANFGYCVSTAGDVNGDGYADVIVGSMFYDNGTLNEGCAYVYHGSASGLNATANWMAESNQENAVFGESVSTAGDVNGDGYADVIVGAFSYSNGEVGEGGAFLYYGSASGLNAAAGWTAESNQANAYFGCSVSTAGDVNGDGYADVIVSAEYYENSASSEGRVYVYYGSSSGLSAAAAWTVEGEQASPQFGYIVSTAGDVNGDGYADVIIGAPHYYNGESGEGRAFVYYGSPSSLSATAAWTAESNQAGAMLGMSVSTAGDVNGDGYADVIAGAPFFDNGEANEGRAFAYYGSASGLNASAAWTAESNQSDARFGQSVSTAGDVNGDGYADVIAGALRYDNGETDEGRAYVYYGSASGLSASAAWMVEGNQVEAYLGNSVSTAGDVNGDGYADVIVGSYYYDKGEANEGCAFVYYGSASGLSASADWTGESNQGGACLGQSVSTAGDVNRDGYADVIVGAWLYDNGEYEEGRLYVYHGSSSGLSPSADWTVEGNQANAYLGLSVSTAGDVNGDGYSDVIAGAYEYDNGEANEGRAYVYYGSASGLSATADWTAESNQADAQFGCSVSTAGDVNGDGYADVIVGARYYDNGSTNEGRAYLYHGSASGLSATAAWTAESNQADAYLGESVSTAGDVNGDGYADVIAGANYYDNGSTNEGGAFVYYGNGEAGRGMSLNPRQIRTYSTTPISHLGLNDNTTWVRLAALGRTPFGRGKVKLECEAKPLGTPFNGSGLFSEFSWSNTGTAGVQLNQILAGFAPGTVYHWRMRLLYNPATTPYQQHSRWFTMPWNGGDEADFRMPLVLPNSPQNPGATAIGLDTITWTWTDNSSNETGFKVYADPGSSDPSTLQTTTAANSTSWPYTGLTPNTQYAFQVAAANASGNSNKTARITRFTLCAPPVLAQNVLEDRNTGTLYPAGTAFSFSNPAGFGAGTHGGNAYRVTKFKYAWDTNAAYSFTGSEPDWNTGTLSFTPTVSGSYYLHAQAFNADDVANATTLNFGPFLLDALAPVASEDNTPDVDQDSTATQYDFTIRFVDETAIQFATLDNADIRVTGPDSYDLLAAFVSSAPGTGASVEIATYSITPPGGAWDSADEGAYTISLESGQITDTAGNPAASGVLGGFHVDFAPTIMLSSADPVFVNGMITVTAALSEPSTTFTEEDIQTVNATVSGFTGSGASYTFNLVPTGSGEFAFSCSVNADVFTDDDGNGAMNFASNTISRNFDNTPPSAVITRVSPATTGADVITFTVAFDEAVSPTFSKTDLTSTGVLWGEVEITGGPSYTVSITLEYPEMDGDVSFDIGTDVTDAAGNAYEGGSSPVCTIANWNGIMTQPQSIRGYAGETAALNVTPNCAGGSAIAYQWKYDDGLDKAITLGPVTPAWNLTLALASGGQYWCEMTYDGEMYESDHVGVDVAEHVSITQQPAGGAIGEGEAHTFTVAAQGGFAPLTYHWNHNGDTIATTSVPSYTVSDATGGDTGDYTVDVIDAYGDSETSNVAVLTVAVNTVPAVDGVMMALLVTVMAVMGAGLAWRRSRIV